MPHPSKYLSPIITAILCILAIPSDMFAQKQFKRDLEQISFIPKGQWITGVSVSYSQSKEDNYQFLIVEGIDGNAYNFKISPMAMYCFKDNLVAGARLGYQRQRMSLNSADVVIDSETDYNIDNLYSISHKFLTTAAFRNYISLGSSKRFGMFNEVQIQFGAGESKICNGTGDDLTGTFSRSYSFDIGLAPGMVMFLNNYSAIEVNVGVLGFSYTHHRAVTDRVHVANYNTKSANFKINLFSITFGVAFYL